MPIWLHLVLFPRGVALLHKHHIPIDGRQILRAAHGHGVAQLRADLLDVKLHAFLGAAVDHGDEGTADEHRVGAQRQRLEDVNAAADAAATAAATGTDWTMAIGYLAAALAVGISGVGSAIAVSSTASAAIGAMVENEGTFGKSLVFVGLAEGIAIYGLLIAIVIVLL